MTVQGSALFSGRRSGVIRRSAGLHVQLYKNNTDFHGHSYGCHDNYLVSRSIPFPSLTAGLLPFLVSRQVIAGAGKVGVEGQESGFVPGHYQLSQRADFMETDLSVDTMHNRPILNTRDEPHAVREKYRRLHLIIGDANMCEYATALKVGTTQLVLELIARGAAPALELEHPVTAVKQLSRDQNLKATVRRKNGSTITGLDIQEQYYLAAEKHLAGADAGDRLDPSRMGVHVAVTHRRSTATRRAARLGDQALAVGNIYAGRADWLG